MKARYSILCGRVMFDASIMQRYLFLIYQIYFLSTPYAWTFLYTV